MAAMGTMGHYSIYVALDCPWAGPEDLGPRAKGQGLEDLSLALMYVR